MSIINKVIMELLEDVFYAGYNAGVGDSEDYDHDPYEMAKVAWDQYKSQL